MELLRRRSLLCCVLVVSAAATALSATIPTSGKDRPENRTFVDVNPVIVPTSICKQGFCSHTCKEVAGKAVCSCPDKMYLLSDGKNCLKRPCYSRFSKDPNAYKCGSNSRCEDKWDFKVNAMMPTCVCKTVHPDQGKYKLNADKMSCSRDDRYKTCSWPTKYSQTCSSCKVVSEKQGYGTHPECQCKRGYKLSYNGHSCIVEDPCLSTPDGKGGCDHVCTYNKQTKVKTCSCHQDSLLQNDLKTCKLKNCANGNSGCTHGCTQLDKNNFYCHCPLGWALNSDGKTCYDVDECSGFHGCDQKCTPDGKGWFLCQCDPGFLLQANGYSCRADDKCLAAGCSQHCNPTLGTCYCDITHQLDKDGKTCVDKDECKLGTSGCQERCENTDGGFTCSCLDPKARLSNDLKTCVLDTCVEVKDTLHGTTNCKHGHANVGTMKIGDYCGFECDKGFKLVGAKTIHCTKRGYDYTAPHCQDINECEDPSRCGADERCVNSPGAYQCVCKNGFSRQAGRCKDVRGPEIITCPDDAILILPADSDTVRFTWKKLRVSDATDKLEDIKCINCPTSEEMQVGLGQTSIRYIYSDKAGNRALCSFKVKVLDVTPPKFTGCPNKTVFQRGPGSYPLEEFVKSIGATDNSGVKPVITHDNPPSFRNPGLRTVNYFAKDASDNFVTCTFYVKITVSECAPLTPPANGYFDNNCDDWHVGNTCEPKCNDGYAFFSHPSNTSYRYQCGSDGIWTPGADTVPDCYAVEPPGNADIDFVTRYKYQGCPNDDPAVQDAVIGMIRDMFKESNSAFCFLFDSCDLVTDPKINCDKAAGTFTITLRTDENYSQIPDHRGMVIEFKKRIRAEMNRVKTSGTFFALIIPPRSVLVPLVNQNGLASTPVFKLSCGQGTKSIDSQCVRCPKGAGC